MVLAGVIALSIGGGVIGVFPFLRKRALISDAISHATLPGIALAFLAGVALGGTGRNLELSDGRRGADGRHRYNYRTMDSGSHAPAGRYRDRHGLKCFGLGIVLLSHIQTLESAGQAGLNSFLLGSTAALTRGNMTVAVASCVYIALALAFMKEFGARSLREDFAAAQGWRVARVGLFMLVLLLAIVAIGLKTVGLILIIALVIIPPAAARFWTDRLGRMIAHIAAFGGLAGWIGGGVSAVFPAMPAGAVIV